MPLTLRHLDAEPPRSSQFNRPRPVRLADDRLGFLLAPVYPGWYVIPVAGGAGGTALRRNGRPVDRTTRLTFGDRLDLGPSRFAVEACTSGDEATGPPLADAATVHVRVGNRAAAEARLTGVGVIGTDPRAAVAVPAETGLDPQHAVLAHVADRWYLFVPGGGARRLGGEPAAAIVLVPGESVWLSDRVELTLECAELDPLDLLARSSGQPSGTFPALAAASSPGGVTRSGEETPSAVVLGGKSASGRADPARAAARRAAVELCTRLQALPRRTPPGAPRPVAAAPFRTSPAQVDSDATPGRLAAALAADPSDPDALFALAGLLRRLGLAELCSWVLAVLNRQNPADPVVNQSLGVHLREQAADPALPPAVRDALIGRARRHLTAARAAGGSDPELAGLLQLVGGDPAGQPT